MRKVYKDPKALAACLKDLVDFYLDGVMTYEKLEEKLNILINANEDRIYKDGNLSLRISNIVGSSGVDLINKVFSERQS
ncbi:TIGR04540 family protein [Clostridium tagluense]|uniref:Ribonuclease P n=1 Tax=Clostridium tagluense TaxID=360422 RepID=A0A401UMA4_9CLOT|nr:MULTISPECIES: TIGR04540 family protein [Clostridium]MBU3126196.1 TIGR04540 family protein [Clostridium tagluense]MBW9155877.1 TIGR04540 family protein [Clostridium tagluense]MBZ9624035.1 TIGR04540 family protein [Clostridium sp. FP2]MCB2298328.1 TIGR04540 family protein [Clostridium tagluense]MCB2309577.1 TIGR04540 family protein [Clostridium tagluense]